MPAPPRFAGKRFRLGRGRAGRWAEVLRGADDRGGQPRWARGRAHARSSLRDKLALDRDAEGRYFIKSTRRRPSRSALGRGRGSATTSCKVRERNDHEKLRRILLAGLGLPRPAARRSRKTTIKIGRRALDLERRAADGEQERLLQGSRHQARAGDICNRRPPGSRVWRRASYNIVAGGISAGYFNALEKNLPIIIAVDRVSTPIGHNLMLRPDLKDTVKSLKDLKGKVDRQQRARARSAPTRPARCWKRSA